jgi:phage FluMu gp28-like protein
MTTAQEILEQLGDPVILLETLCELDGFPLKLEPYQVNWIRDRATFRICVKSRQIGYSTVIAAETFANMLIRPSYKANVVSINQTEAADKVEIVRNLYHSIPDAFAAEEFGGIKKVLWKDAENELAVGRPPYVSTFVSQPASSAIRGGRKDVLLDEFAHIRDSKKVYKAALPAITRGGGRLSIVSTPLGQSGMFHDIATDVISYPGYSRHKVPWWVCSAMVRSPELLAEAIALSEGDGNDMLRLGSEERVRKYGTPALIEIFDGFGGDLMGFQTEYEAIFVDETEAYYPWELILAGVDDTQAIWKHLPPGWEAEGSVSIGVDLAKDRDESVFTVVEMTEIEGERHAYVRMIHRTQDDYEDQLKYLLKLIKQSGARRVSIDQTGVGQMFVEKAKREVTGGVSVEGIVFTNAKKEKWATTFKGELQGVPTVHYPRHNDLMRQIHGIRRTKSDAGFYKFSGGSGAKRDDHFWSLCLGLYGEGRTPARISSLGS